MTITLKVSVILITIFLSNITFADRQTSNSVSESIRIGQTKTITLEMFGAATAKYVTVTGRGVVANIVRKTGNRITIRLRSLAGAQPGLQEIRVGLLAGVHRVKLYVYGLNRATITVDRSTPKVVGEFVKVSVAMNRNQGILKVSSTSNCFIAQTNSAAPNTYFQQNTAKQAAPNIREFWVATNDNRERTKNCTFTLNEISRTNTGPSRNRVLNVTFNQDRRYPLWPTGPRQPPAINAPGITTRDNVSSRTANRSGNSPTLKWVPVRYATSYLVRYIQLKNNRRPNVNWSKWRRQRSRSGLTLNNLPIGRYNWCVQAVNYPPRGRMRILPRLQSDCSAIKSFIIQQNR